MPLRRMRVGFSLILFTCVLHRVYTEKYRPILLWHSAGETCCDKEGKLYYNFITSELQNDVYVRSVKMGNTTEDDFTRSLTVHPFDQIDFVCNKLKNNEKFKNGYNAVGFSQGALFLRGLAQICPSPPMLNLISLGGPHQGVFQYPRCNQMFGEFRCRRLKFKMNSIAYFRLFQISLSPSTYWHDDFNEIRYKRGSTFLAIINNEIHYNADYVKNLQALKRFVLVKYANDISVIPNESAHFGFCDRNGKALKMEETELFQQDRLGLKTMQDERKLIKLNAPMEHLVLDERWFRENILPILKEI